MTIKYIQQSTDTMQRNDYSWSEIALGYWATLTLAIMAVTSLILRYVMSYTICFAPAQFTYAHMQYAYLQCFQTQYISTSLETENPESRFTYHQWLPFFLGVASLLCLLPHVIWRMLSGLLWLDAHALSQSVADNQRQNAEKRHVMLRETALLLQAGLKSGNSILTLAALGRKVLVCLVYFIQILLMAVVFKPQLSIMTENEKEEENTNASVPLPVGPFMCDYSVRHMDNVQRYSHMCLLPTAQVYSKGLAFLFFLFFTLFLLCALDIVLWAGRLILPGLRDLALQRYLSVISDSDTQDSSPAHWTRFLESLGLDGRFLLAVIADHCGPLAAADLTNHVWLVFNETPRKGNAPSAPLGSASAPQPDTDRGAVDESSGEPGSVPMVTISDQDGDTTDDQNEKGKLC